MAQFMTTIQGNRGETSRLGSKNSGMVARVNGWDSGVTVIAGHDDEGDFFNVYQTGGSNHTTAQKLIGVLRNGEFTPATF